MNIQQLLAKLAIPSSPSEAGDAGQEVDITALSVQDIFRSELFTAEQRKRKYRRRGKSPSGVIDGVYNDTYLEDDDVYSDCNRDWEADA